MYLRKVIKISGSYFISIPKPIAKDFQLQRGEYLSVSLNAQNQVIVQKINLKIHKEMFVPGIGTIKKHGKK